MVAMAAVARSSRPPARTNLPRPLDVAGLTMSILLGPGWTSVSCATRSPGGFSAVEPVDSLSNTKPLARTVCGTHPRVPWPHAMRRPGSVVGNGLQQPLFGQRVAAQLKGPQRRVRAESDLHPPVFDADQVAASDGCCAAGVPPGVASEPVLGIRVGVDEPDQFRRGERRGVCLPGRSGPGGRGIGWVQRERGSFGGASFVVLMCGGLGGLDEGEFVPVGGVAG